MTVNVRYANYGSKDVNKNMNEDRPTLSAAKMQTNDTSSSNISYMQIFAEVPRGGGVKRRQFLAI